MTPQQHKQHLLALADECDRKADKLSSPGTTGLDVDAAERMLRKSAIELRSFAARLTPGISDAMCELVQDELLRQCGTLDSESEMPVPDVADVRAALEAVFPLVDEDKWQPIESAPEGEIIVYMPEERFKIQAANWGGRVRIIGNVFDFDRTKPTHWMPLPAPPADAAMAAPPKDETP